jgi:hypothetical protein
MQRLHGSSRKRRLEQDIDDDDDDASDVESCSGFSVDLQPVKKHSVKKWLEKTLDKKLEVLQQRLGFPGSTSSDAPTMGPPSRPIPGPSHYLESSGIYATSPTAFRAQPRFTQSSFQQRAIPYWGQGIVRDWTIPLFLKCFELCDTSNVLHLYFQMLVLGKQCSFPTSPG